MVPESGYVTDSIWNGVFPQQVSVYLPPGCATHGAFQVVLVVKSLPANTADTRDMGSISGLGRSLVAGRGTPLQFFSLENLLDREAWQAIV